MTETAKRLPQSVAYDAEVIARSREIIAHSRDLLERTKLRNSLIVTDPAAFTHSVRPLDFPKR